ncbi:hypothetical protein ACE02G_14280 [Shewanella xiamenensis]|uniref:hypothetical protein n=1 Tax=Shewanella xiamenensis TaxID=332186 RepID=UPI0035B980AD
MTNLAERICVGMSSLEFVGRSYPMLSTWGVHDEDVLIHSLGCSAWNALGSELGFMAVTECPVPMTHGADIRSDSTWFSQTKRMPEVLIEFERFDGTERGQKKLDEKLCNLLEASMRWGDAPSVLILSAWNKGVVSAPNKDVFVQRCRQGFKSSVGVQVPPLRNTTVLFSRFIFEIDRSGTLFLKQIRCERLM